MWNNDKEKERERGLRRIRVHCGGNLLSTKVIGSYWLCCFAVLMRRRHRLTGESGGRGDSGAELYLLPLIMINESKK